MLKRTRRILLPAMLIAALFASSARAQIDPERRQLIQLGYNKELVGKGPLSAYAFYHLNRPGFMHTNLTLRLVVAPVYLDSELGIHEALGPNTDLAVGLAGGGYADTYSEVRGGKFFQAESFTGHGGEISSSIYHLFNPESLIPLHGILRGAAHYSTYEQDSETAGNFEMPSDLYSFNVRAGLRWGGREPVMLPDVAMELSLWYEGQFRHDSDLYGFANDRRIESHSHLFWGRALLAYTLPELGHNFSVSLTAGTSAHPDRFSAYRLGGVLPMAAEFPLNLPGYYYEEISARRFAILAGQYSLPLDADGRWSLTCVGSVAVVDYLSGLEQPGHFHSGIGGGVLYKSRTGFCQVLAGYGYGIDARRNGERGGHSIGLLVQFDLDRAAAEVYGPFENPYRSRGLFRFLGGP